MKVYIKTIYFLTIFGFLSFLGSCGSGEDIISYEPIPGNPMDSYYMYTLNNTSGYSVIIKIEGKYKTEIFGEYKTADYNLSNNDTSVLYTDDNEMHFTWTASSSSNNLRIRCETSGSVVNFRRNE